MATGEYVSVSSQRDTEVGDLAKERVELAADPLGETSKLGDIYRRRGLSAPLAAQVADDRMEEDPLAAHARDELGLNALVRFRRAVVGDQLHARWCAATRRPRGHAGGSTDRGGGHRRGRASVRNCRGLSPGADIAGEGLGVWVRSAEDVVHPEESRREPSADPRGSGAFTGSRSTNSRRSDARRSGWRRCWMG